MDAASPDTATRRISNVIIPMICPENVTTSDGPSEADTIPPTYDITVQDHVITSISPSSSKDTSQPPSLLLPTLSHPHIHLDKPYLLTSHNSCLSHTNDNDTLPSYADLAPKTGSFGEALSSTSAAKSRFTVPDLLLRGRQLLATSYTQGVTSARCFVEVDATVERKSVDAGVQLQREFGGLVGVQLCVFAQDPVFSSDLGEENRRWVERVLRMELDGKVDPKEGDEFSGIRVLGSTPYVEDSRDNAIRNIEWAVKMAMKYNLHLDFHLDYNLDQSKKAEELLVWEVLRVLKKEGWPTTTESGKRRTVVVGHCSALTLLSHQHLVRLAKEIQEAKLPVYFVGLPTSDLYMMGRPPALPPPTSSADSPSADEDKIQAISRLRGTLNVPLLRQLYGIKAVLGVNNVGNAFTPYGSGDPLELAGWCVGLMQDGTEVGVRSLFQGVSMLARKALGIDEEMQDEENEPEGQEKSIDDRGVQRQQIRKAGWIRAGIDIHRLGVLLVKNDQTIVSSTSTELAQMKVPARQRWSVRDVVWDVPRVELRSVIR